MIYHLNIVTLQAQREYPPNMQCKDKFLVQSTIVAPNTNVDELPPDMVTTLNIIVMNKYLLIIVMNILINN